MKRTKRTLAVLLALMLVFTAIPMGASAEAPEEASIIISKDDSAFTFSEALIEKANSADPFAANQPIDLSDFPDITADGRKVFQDLLNTLPAVKSNTLEVVGLEIGAYSNTHLYFLAFVRNGYDTVVNFTGMDLALANMNEEIITNATTADDNLDVKIAPGYSKVIIFHIPNDLVNNVTYDSQDFKYDYNAYFDILPTPFMDIFMWAKDDIEWAYENKLFSGIDKTKFAPNSNVNRAMFAQILWSMAGKPEPTSTSPFKDVKTSDWFYKSVCWAAENEIVTGTTPTTYNPMGLITREQFALMLYRYAKYSGKDVSATNDLSTFPDSGSVHTWAIEEVKWAVGAGIITGTNNKLNPTGYASRAQAATMLRRF